MSNCRNLALNKKLGNRWYGQAMSKLLELKACFVHVLQVCEGYFYTHGVIVFVQSRRVREAREEADGAVGVEEEEGVSMKVRNLQAARAEKEWGHEDMDVDSEESNPIVNILTNTCTTGALTTQIGCSFVAERQHSSAATRTPSLGYQELEHGIQEQCSDKRFCKRVAEQKYEGYYGAVTDNIPEYGWVCTLSDKQEEFGELCDVPNDDSRTPKDALEEFRSDDMLGSRRSYQSVCVTEYPTSGRDIDNRKGLHGDSPKISERAQCRDSESCAGRPMRGAGRASVGVLSLKCSTQDTSVGSGYNIFVQRSTRVSGRSDGERERERYICIYIYIYTSISFQSNSVGSLYKWHNAHSKYTCKLTN